MFISKKKLQEKLCAAEAKGRREEAETAYRVRQNDRIHERINNARDEMNRLNARICVLEKMHQGVAVESDPKPTEQTETPTIGF